MLGGFGLERGGGGGDGFGAIGFRVSGFGVREFLVLGSCGA